MNNEPPLDFVNEEIEALHHTPRTIKSRRYFVKGQLAGGFFLMFLFPSVLLSFEVYLSQQTEIILPLSFLLGYFIYELVIFMKYKNIDLRKVRLSGNT
jgi:hypothetical protein